MTRKGLFRGLRRRAAPSRMERRLRERIDDLENSRDNLLVALSQRAERIEELEDLVSTVTPADEPELRAAIEAYLAVDGYRGDFDALERRAARDHLDALLEGLYDVEEKP